MEQRLKKITVRGYKSIKDQEVKLNNRNILIGANGAGKSNFIAVFRFLREIVEKRLQVSVRASGGGNRLLHYGNKLTDTVFFDLEFDSNSYWLELAPTKDDSLFIEFEKAGFQSPEYRQPIWEEVSNGTLESQLKEYHPIASIVYYTYNALKTWRVYHFHDTSNSAPVKKKAAINDNAFLREDAGNLAAFLYWIRERHPKYYLRIVKTIQLVVPDFQDFNLRPDPSNEQYILLEWQKVDSDFLFNAAELSDGSLRFICISTVLLQPNPPGLIILDEPELGLHPAAINILAGLLKKASHKSQVIVSTQSAALVSQFSPEDILVVEQKENSTHFTRQDSETLKSWLEDYTLGNLWEKNVIGGRP